MKKLNIYIIIFSVIFTGCKGATNNMLIKQSPTGYYQSTEYLDNKILKEVGEKAAHSLLKFINTKKKAKNIIIYNKSVKNLTNEHLNLSMIIYYVNDVLLKNNIKLFDKINEKKLQKEIILYENKYNIKILLPDYIFYGTLNDFYYKYNEQTVIYYYFNFYLYSIKTDEIVWVDQFKYSVRAIK